MPKVKKNQSVDQVKDFKGAIKRLFHELKRFRVLIIVSLILAALGSILSISAPDRLANLTDTISNGLVINSDKLKEITTSITNNVSVPQIKEIVPKLLDLQLNETVIGRVMTDQKISNEEKQSFQVFLGKVKQSQDPLILLTELGTLSDNVLEYMLQPSIYHELKITSKEKIEFVKSLSNKDNIVLSNNFCNLFFPEIKIDGEVISGIDQYAFLTIMSSLKEDATGHEVYQKIDEMPYPIRHLVEPHMDMDKVIKITIFLVAIYIISAIFMFIEALCMTHVSNNFARKLRTSISKKINCLPLKYFDQHAIGDILSRVTNDIDTIAQSMDQSLSTLVSSITLLVGSLIMMFVTNWIMALTAIFSSIIGFVGMIFVLSKSQKYFVARQTELGHLNGHIEEVYSGLNVVKTSNAKREVDEKFDEFNIKVQVSNQKSQFLSGLMMPMMNFIGNFGYVAVCIVGALLTLNHVISFGVIVAFISYVRLFTSPLSQIAQAFTSLQSTAAASERVFEFLDEKEMPLENPTVTLNKDEVKGTIEFKNVVFKYDGNKEATIKNFSAKANPGQKIAIVGPTGAGKTTMVNLLMKFYDIDSGDILIDGVSTKDLSRENIHSLFTMVLQDTWLFSGTVKENIMYNQPDVSDEKIKEVCHEVGLNHFIKTLPNTYQSEISDNDSVSSGQRQLLTIARGMLEECPFLILDEATSNVDTRTEELVQQAMDKLTEGKTSFIIAHRLSTIKNADLILVMKDGNIVEQGNHQELMKQQGFYANLYNSQFEL